MSTATLPLSPLPHIPAEVRCAQDYEDLARHFIAAPSLAYIAGGCGRDSSVLANRMALEELAIVPRLLRDLKAGHTRLDLLGRSLSHPLLLAPVAYQTLVHPRGELETARGAAAMEAALIVSTLASHTLEAIAAQGPGERWFQLYFQPDRGVTEDLVRRAEASGYQVLVVTLDASIKTPSLSALKAGFEMPEQVRAVNLDPYPMPPPIQLMRGQSRIFQGVMAFAPGWDDLAWLVDRSRLPVVVKGVLHPDDARRLKAMGVAGQVVSNHGGRALDGAVASVRLLPRVRAAVGEHYPLLVDGGVRSGADVFRMLALGADAVLLGRLQLYALAVAGSLGVAHMLKLLREELELCMAQAGCASLADIRQDMIYRERDEA
ncbi:alpha-hydroxy acid oxidase [Azovibrio restrictus]|uniref:alpha-hydroxy acid oxidase n=1 Tax=Azovibrio restrictus TaxID=146938 RepID=UPI0026EC2283|nr:alpha-hydroxy acid oxidase [Azovibrio restrictus]